MDRKFVTAFTAGLLLLCLIPHISAIEEEEVDHEYDDASSYKYQQPLSRAAEFLDSSLARNFEEQARLYFQGENFTVNLIPLVICGVILALMAVGAFLIIDLLLNGDNDQETGYGGGSGYGAPATGSGYGAPADTYGAPAPQASYGAAPAPSYSAPAPSPSYAAAPASSYGYLKRTLNTASRVEKALDEAEALYK